MNNVSSNPPTYFRNFSCPISQATLGASFKCYHILANLLPSHLYFILPIVMCHLVSIKLIMLMINTTSLPELTAAPFSIAIQSGEHNTNFRPNTCTLKNSYW